MIKLCFYLHIYPVNLQLCFRFWSSELSNINLQLTIVFLSSELSNQLRAFNCVFIFRVIRSTYSLQLCFIFRVIQWVYSFQLCFPINLQLCFYLQSYPINLQLTSVISKLALVPHPCLHEFLLYPYLPLKPGIRNLFTIFQKVKKMLNMFYIVVSKNQVDCMPLYLLQFVTKLMIQSLLDHDM